MSAATTREALSVGFRWLIRRDLPAVLGIERASFPRPWTEDDFLAVLRRRTCIGMVAEAGNERVVGYALYELHRDRLHVLNLAVDPSSRRMGVGWRTAAWLAAKLHACRRRKMTVAVSDANLAACLFWKACGFTATGVLRNYYGDGTDAIRFRLDAPEVSPCR